MYLLLEQIITKLEKLQILNSMKLYIRLFWFISLLLFLNFEIKGQIKIDTSKARVIIEIDSIEKFNDELLKKASSVSNFNNFVIKVNRKKVKLNLDYLENSHTLEIIGEGSTSISFGDKCYSNLQKIIIFTEVKNIEFSKCMSLLDTLIMNNSNLEKLPKTLCYCTNLKFLDLSFNKISNFNCELESLKKLKKIVITQNLLAEIPKCLVQNRELEVLNFEFNPLENVPIELLELENLKIINIISYPAPNIPQLYFEQKKVKVYY